MVCRYLAEGVMIVKPYLSCPVCGEKQVSLRMRIACFRTTDRRFRCARCGTRFQIPGWCGLLQVVTLLLMSVCGYYLAEWLGLRTAGGHLALMLLMMFLGLDGLGLLFAYNVPFEVLEKGTPCHQPALPESMPPSAQRAKKSKRFWAGVVAATVCLVVLPVFWLQPLCSMPILDGAALENAVEQQIAADAKEGHFGVVYGDASSVRVTALELESDDVLVLAHGSLTSDRGTFPWAVLLKKVPFVQRYVYDTRYRFQQPPAAIENVKYAILSYSVKFHDGVLAVNGEMQKGRVVVLLVFPYLWINSRIARKCETRKRKNP